MNTTYQMGEEKPYQTLMCSLHMMKSLSMFFVGDDDIATGDEGISADENGNFDVYGDLFLSQLTCFLSTRSRPL